MRGGGRDGFRRQESLKREISFWRASKSRLARRATIQECSIKGPVGENRAGRSSCKKSTGLWRKRKRNVIIPGGQFGG